MTLMLASLCLLIGFVYVIVPGPIFLSLVGLIACRGKRKGCRLIAGCLLGDLGWTAIALISLVSSRLIEPRLFLGLSALCGAYLVWLAIKALRSSRNLEENETMNARRPLRRGIALGLFNPKSYPVMLSLQSSLVGASLLNLSPDALLIRAIEIYLWIAIGIIAAYGVFVFICAAPLVKRAFLKHSAIITRVIGLLFLFFGTSLLVKLGRELLL